MILTLLILLIDDDKHKILAPVPFTLVILDIPGKFLYPKPLDVKFILLTPPDVFLDDVS